MSPTYRTPYAAQVLDYDEAVCWQHDDRDTAIEIAVEEEVERLCCNGDEQPLMLSVAVYSGVEWCSGPEDDEPCPCGRDHIDTDGDPCEEMIGHASREVVQVHRYGAADLAAHLRERDDLREVLRLVRAAWWRTDQEIVPMGGHEGYACARIGPDHATSGHWWSRVWIEAWATTGQQIVNRHASEEEARAFVVATMQADGWVVLP